MPINRSSLITKVGLSSLTPSLGICASPSISSDLCPASSRLYNQSTIQSLCLSNLSLENLASAVSAAGSNPPVPCIDAVRTVHPRGHSDPETAEPYPCAYCLQGKFIGIPVDARYLTLCSRSRPQHRNSMHLAGGRNRGADKARYCVRPNSGRIEPGKDVEVQGPNHPRIRFETTT